MAITQRNEYLPGRDLTNLAQNVDLNRIGMDMTDISVEWNDPADVTVAQGSMIECNGNIYVIEGGNEDFTMTLNTDNYLTFTDSPTPAFGSSDDIGTYSAEKGGYYQGVDNNIRTLKWYVNQTYKEYSGDLFLVEPYGNQKVYGYLDDGTPLFATTVSVSVASGDIENGAPHGISNAKTNQRILSVCPVSSLLGYVVWNDGSPIEVDDVYWDDTNISILRSNTAADIDKILFIVYK